MSIPPAPSKIKEEVMSNNEKFNAMLNSCKNPIAVYNALLALVESGAFAELRNSFSGANVKKEASHDKH